MKLGFRILLILAVNFSTCCCKHASIIGSHLVNSESKYKLFLESKGMSSLNFFLGGGNNESVSDFSTNPVLKKFNPPIDESGSYSLKLTADDSSGCKEQSVGLIKTSDSPMVFIYLSKPIYRTGENVKFRIFVLNQKMIPFIDHAPMTVSIFDSKNNMIKKISDAKVSNFGDFEESVEIADDPNLGEWKIEVEINKRKISKFFKVRKYVQGDIEVLVDYKPIVAFEDKIIYFTIYTENQDGNFVIGNVKIHFSGRFKGSNRTELTKKQAKMVEIYNSKSVVDINFHDDLSIRFPTADMILNFIFEVTEKSTQKTKNVSVEIEMKHKGRQTIHVVGKKYFKPGFKHPVKIRVKLFDGKTDNSFNQLSVGIEYKKGNKTIGEKNYQTDLKNGEHPVLLQPTAAATNIIINTKFARVEHTEMIERFPTFGANEYMQVNVLKSAAGRQLKISAQTSGEMETLHVLVFGLNGIIHNDEFSDAVGKDIYNFTIAVTEEMKPEARGIVFYIKPNTGFIIYDEFSIPLGFSIENSLEITAEEAIKPNEDPNIKIITEEGSNVFLSAIDHNSAIIDRNNEISRSDIYNELTYYINMKFPNTSRYHFEKLNAFILEPLINGSNCRSSINHSDSDNNDKTSDDVERDFQYFPDVIFDQMINSSSNVNVTKLPSSLKSWRLFGVSVHPQKGFTVAKEQPQITVKSDFSVHIEAPSLIRIGDILKIKVTASNFLQTKLDGSIIVEITNGKFMNGKAVDPRKSITEQISLEPNEKIKSLEFFVSSNELKTMLIKATIKVGSDEYFTEKSIKIEPYKTKIKLRSDSFLIESSMSKSIKFPKDSVFVVYGNLLGPALNGLETIFHMPMQRDEEKMMKFSAAIINYKFMALKKNENHPIAVKAKNDIIKGYQEALRILHDKNSKYLRFAALITGILIDAKGIIDVDDELIKDALKFIEGHQYNNGSFKSDYETDPRREFNDNKFSDEIQTALIVQTFIKAKHINLHSGSIVQNSLDFLNKQSTQFNDYARVITAYTFALNNDIETAQQLISSVKNESRNMKYWKYHAMYTEILSYSISTKILIKEDPKDEIKELISNHRNATGGFYSPYDTVIALQALYDYTKSKENLSKGFSFTIDGENSSFSNHLDYKEFNFSESDKNLKVTGDGLGYAIAYYGSAAKTPQILFKTENVKITSSGNIKDLFVTFNYNPKKSENGANLVVIELDIPIGYKFNTVLEANFDYKMEPRSDDTVMAFYVDKISKNKVYDMKIRTSKLYDIENDITLILKVYDYYRPNLPAIGYIRE